MTERRPPDEPEGAPTDAAPARLLDGSLGGDERAALLAGLSAEPPAAASGLVWAGLLGRIGPLGDGGAGGDGGPGGDGGASDLVQAGADAAATSAGTGAVGTAASGGALGAGGSAVSGAALGAAGGGAVTAAVKSLVAAFAVGVVTLGVGGMLVAPLVTAPPAVVPSTPAAVSGLLPTPAPEARRGELNGRSGAEAPLAPSPAVETRPPPRPLAAPTAPAAESPAPAPPPTIADPALESRLVGAARDRLRAGDPAGALRALRKADAQVPGGTLAQEREVLAVEALVASGDRAAARRRASAFLAVYPQSPLAARLRPIAEP